MTAFEKSLRALDEETLRAGAEELLTLLAQTPGGQRGETARVSAPVAADVSQEKDGGESAEASAAGAPAPGEARPETARTHRAYPETDSGTPAANDAAREDGDTVPEPASPKAAAGEDREKRESQEEREARKGQNDREDREEPENRDGGETRKDREDREEPETPIRTLRAQDGETVDPAEARSLEKKLQSVSRQRRGRVPQSGEGGENGAHTAAFRGPERQYEGAVGARGTEMRRISDYFRRVSRRYDTGFTMY